MQQVCPPAKPAHGRPASPWGTCCPAGKAQVGVPSWLASQGHRLPGPADSLRGPPSAAGPPVLPRALGSRSPLSAWIRRGQSSPRAGSRRAGPRAIQAVRAPRPGLHPCCGGRGRALPPARRPPGASSSTQAPALQPPQERKVRAPWEPQPRPPHSPTPAGGEQPSRGPDGATGV